MTNSGMTNSGMTDEEKAIDVLYKLYWSMGYRLDANKVDNDLDRVYGINVNQLDKDRACPFCGQAGLYGDDYPKEALDVPLHIRPLWVKLIQQDLDEGRLK